MTRVGARIADRDRPDREFDGVKFDTRGALLDIELDLYLASIFVFPGVDRQVEIVGTWQRGTGEAHRQRGS